MNHYPASIRALIRGISRLPGIGEKTAERLSLHLLRTPASEVRALAQSILDMKEKVRLCVDCFALSDGERCGICGDPARDNGQLCVVEQPADMVAIEKSGGFGGRYHILQGVLSPVDGVGPGDVRIRELMARVAGGSVREVIVATGTSVEGDATAAYIAERLAEHPLRVSRIASGVPVGGDLKFIDQVTLKRALEKRHDV